MIDKICTFLTNRIRKEMPEIDDERAEVIFYGLQNIVGEIPKVFIMLVVAYILGIFWLSLFTFVALFIYKGASGGVHLKTHIGCILFTTGFYCIIPYISQFFVMPDLLKYIVISLIWIFGMIMIKLYAPADTENVPILAKKDRRKKQIISYISYTIGLIIALIIPYSTIANIIVIAYFVQTLTITRLAYKLTNSKYGYEVYGETSEQSA